jgi:iron complex outermembrane recepter protein
MSPKNKVLLISAVFIFALISNASAQDQGKIRIEVKDVANESPLSGALIVYQNILAGKTNEDGVFLLETILGSSQTVKVNAEGYTTYTFEIIAGTNTYHINLSSLHIDIGEVHVISQRDPQHQTIIAASVIDRRELETTMGIGEFIETFQYSPGVYTSRQGGGYGDARVTVRGFSNEDLDVNINGVTLKGTEGGTIFWSNWSGINDFTDRVEIERGLGAQSLGSNAYGGTINITTMLPKEKAVQQAGMEFSNALGPKMSVLLQTGKMKNGWAVMAGANRVKGDGWVDGTSADAWAYYFASTKVIAQKHALALRIFGAPQEHDQRSSKLSDSIFNKYGIAYNADWGYKNGNYYTSSKNIFHKPVFAFEHSYMFQGDQSLNTTLSLTTGSGGATRSFGAPLPFDSNGQIDFDQAIKNNQDAIDTLALGNGHYLSGYQASHFLGNFQNKHVTYAVDSRLRTRLNKEFMLITGIELRLFSTRDWAEVEDLLGADYVVNGADQNFGMQGAAKGDRIWFNSKSNIDSESAYAQLEYSKDKWNAFIFGSLLNSGFQRTDLFAVSPNNSSDRVNLISGRTRGGLSRKLNTHQTAYVNAGYFTRPPAMEIVFISGIKPPVDLAPEKVMAIEAGYDIRYSKMNIKLNAYLMDWKDKSFIAPMLDPFSNEFVFPRIKGVNATIRGLEAEVKTILTNALELTAGISLGDWIWGNDVNAVVQSTNGNSIDTVHVYSDGLKIANSPQTQGYARVNFTGIKNTFIILDGTYSDRLYADFNVTSRTDANYRTQPYQLPSFAVFSLHAGYALKKVRGAEIAFSGHVNNIFDTAYRNDGIDIPDSKPTALFFYGLGRNYSVGTKVIF